jgi:hypothetical protein
VSPNTRLDFVSLRTVPSNDEDLLFCPNFIYDTNSSASSNLLSMDLRVEKPSLISYAGRLITVSSAASISVGVVLSFNSFDIFLLIVLRSLVLTDRPVESLLTLILAVSKVVGSKRFPYSVFLSSVFPA